MFRKLLPRNEDFFGFFERHAAFIVKGASQLASFSLPGHDPQKIFDKIKECEEEGDKITHACVEALHKTFITPIERGDIHRLMSAMDDTLDEIEDIGKLMLIYRLDRFPEDALKMSKIIIQATESIEAGIREFRKMKMTEVMKQHFFNVNHLENEADTLLIKALSRLFDEEKDVKTIIKWKEVYEHLEKTADICEDVANILEGILLENE